MADIFGFLFFSLKTPNSLESKKTKVPFLFSKKKKESAIFIFKKYNKSLFFVLA